MLSQIYRPEGAIAQMVDFLWLEDGYSPAWKKERLLPSRVFALILNLRGEPFRVYRSPEDASARELSDVVISGMQSRPQVLESASRVATLGLVIKPGWAPALLDQPADTFTDRTVALEDVWDRSVSDLRDRIRSASTPVRMFRAFEQLLERRLEISLAPHPAVRMGMTRLEDTSASVSVRDVVDDTGLSQRHFSQLCREQMGLTPKQYARIYRFEQVLNSIARRADVDWMDITFSAGYYDQSHFIRDFRKLAGCTPTDYLRSETENLHHVEIP